MTRASLYMRVSTVDQHPETQLLDLRQMAAQRGLDIVHEYTDKISGTKAKRPGLDAMMSDARRGKFDVVLVWASDRIARSVKHFLDILDELNRLQIEYISFRENIDTVGPLGRAIVIIIGAVAELERNLIIERVRAGMRRARLEGMHIGRNPLVLDNLAIKKDRERGQSLRQIAKGTTSQQPPCSACFVCPRLKHKSWKHSIKPPEPAPSPCDKRGSKNRPANLIKSMAGSHDPAV
jgi:DNA invertase Pin-like site-specific DNA recombinase